MSYQNMTVHYECQLLALKWSRVMAIGAFGQFIEIAVDFVYLPY